MKPHTLNDIATPPQIQNVYLTSLGCSKNLVDSEVMLGHLELDGFNPVQNPEKADVIVVNTCAFIEPSKRESLQTIFQMSEFKKTGTCSTLVVAGCLAQRYWKELEDEIPEIDLLIGTGEYHRITQLIAARKEAATEKKSFVEVPKYIHTELDPRVTSTKPYMAWLKVSEGCDRKCTFCIIPKLRGGLRSRSLESLKAETERLVESGVQEIHIISQDLSSYGQDLHGKPQLKELIEMFDSVEKLKWARLYYYYPDDMTDEAIEALSKSKKLVPYLDMPIQHMSNSVLKKMNRRVTRDIIFERVNKLRSLLPNLVIRSSVIVGFPGESNEDFLQLKDGIKKLQFDHLGVFKYSDEEGTPSYKLKPKVNEQTINKRFEEIYQIQKKIADKKSQSWVGQTLKVLIEGYHPESELLLIGRHYGQAPDIDGQVIINDTKDKAIEIGSFYNVKITDSFEYDLVGSILT